MNNLLAQHQVAAIYQAMLGKKADLATLNYFGYKIASEQLSLSGLANSFTLAQDGKNRYDGLNDNEKINYIYANITGTQPDAATLAKLVAQIQHGTALGSIAVTIVNQIESYNGSDETTLSQQAYLQKNINTTLFPAFDKSTEFSPFAADIQAAYYVLGAAQVSSGINYWADKLINTHNNLDKIAQVFINDRSQLLKLSDEDFVRKIFHNTFGSNATAQDIINYASGLQNHTETRGEVVVRMIHDIRNDNDHPAAKQLFTAATHVYLAGELPALQYQEVVASFYITIAKSSVPASALDTYSKMLAAGTTEAQLLKILSASSQFSTAEDYGVIYQRLYYSTLTAAESQAILLKAGNDKLTATLLVINAFRDGKYPLDNHPIPPAHSLLQNYENNLGNTLNYQKTFDGVFSLSDNGKLLADINTHQTHELTHAEIASLTLLNQFNINATANIAVDLSMVPFIGTTKIVLSGTYATSATVLNSLGNKTVELLLTDANIKNSDATQSLKTTMATVESGTDLSNAKINLLVEKQLYWAGNSVNGGANHIGNGFLAQSNADVYSSYNMLSANFITKSIYLTSNDNINFEGSIVSNVSQFLYFTYIDLTNYRGTGEIYMNGQRVATEGSKVFDFGLFSQNASIHNSSYDNVSALQQAELPKATIHNEFTGAYGGVISAYSGDLTLLNVGNEKFTIGGELTKDSSIKIYDTAQSDTSFRLEFTEEASHIQDLNMGTFSFTSDHKETLEIFMFSNLDTVQNRTLTLGGGDNSISDLLLNGRMYTGDKAVALNLTIAADFSDNLHTIRGSDYVDRRYYSDMKLKLVAEKGGTGGGSFYNTLNSLANKGDFTHIIDDLAGYQLTLDDTGLTVLTASVKGNTTLDHARALTFADSTIDNMVTLNGGYQNSVINVGDNGNPWIFSKAGDKTATLYGSATSQAEIQNAFSGLTAANDAQDLFSQILAKMTHGASTNNLSEVGLLKLDKSVYVIVDNNHNQAFDANDLVFSIGNQDPYLAAVTLHYQAPAIDVNGAAAESHLAEALV